MNFQNYLLDAIDAVLSWDIPEEFLAEAVHAQAGMMARISSDEVCLD